MSYATMPCSATAAELAYDGGGTDDRSREQIAEEAAEYIDLLSGGHRIGHHESLDLFYEVATEMFRHQVRDLIAEAAVEIAIGRDGRIEVEARIGRLVTTLVRDVAQSLAEEGY